MTNQYLEIEKFYGTHCFNELEMQKRLPKKIYEELKKVQLGKQSLKRDIAEVVAECMKAWATENGATHYTHWFQPLTGMTAEKHDSFINPTKDGQIIMEFSGKELIKGEPDASSFPNGGLRSTFEARGYTAWDTSSPAFLREDSWGITLVIPTAFVSYTGFALDKKVPLLRSMAALERETLRVMHALGQTEVKHIDINVGPEQEYFLVSKKLYDARPDLRFTGRTVFGTMSAKGQELDDHYFGSIKEQVGAYMHEVNQVLWKMGISAKTQHNEVAPHQYELACVFDTTNVTVDRNQMVMEVLQKVAERHDLVCLLHEKPFAGVNGSGKHNNWGLMTDTGVNLFSPGKTYESQLTFVLFLVSVMKAVDSHAKLIRSSAACAGNDHRLGGHEAPPAVISMYLGDDLVQVIEELGTTEFQKQKKEKLELGIPALSRFSKDMGDRNRTSPFAYTGNKFEFRMVGSSQSLAGPNTIVNSAMASVLQEVATRLEGAKNPEAEVLAIIGDFYRDHNRIVFNGNGYSDEWVEEAARRGLPKLDNTVAAHQVLTEPESVELFTSMEVFTKEELLARQEIYLERYSKQINIEAGVMIQMARRLIFPAVSDYLSKLGKSLTRLDKAGVPSTSLKRTRKTVETIAKLLDDLLGAADRLEIAMEKALSLEADIVAQAESYSKQVTQAMAELREIGDALEGISDRRVWPYPSYEDLLFSL